MKKEEIEALKEKRQDFIANYSIRDRVCFNCSFARRLSRSHGEFGDLKFICGEASKSFHTKGLSVGSRVYAWDSCEKFKPNCYTEASDDNTV